MISAGSSQKGEVINRAEVQGQKICLFLFRFSVLVTVDAAERITLILYYHLLDN
jgi:hypothetical protein